MTHKHTAKPGFTLVEIIVVIVVIGILATIGTLGYGNIQKRARNLTRYQAVTAYYQIFKDYGAMFGKYPSMPAGGYCLGRGFKDVNGDGIGDCHDLNYGLRRFDESNTLMTQLEKIGSQLPNEKNTIKNNYIGPYVIYRSDTEIYTRNWFEGGMSDCPKDMQAILTENGVVICSKRLPSL